MNGVASTAAISPYRFVRSMTSIMVAPGVWAGGDVETIVDPRPRRRVLEGHTGAVAGPGALLVVRWRAAQGLTHARSAKVLLGPSLARGGGGATACAGVKARPEIRSLVSLQVP